MAILRWIAGSSMCPDSIWVPGNDNLFGVDSWYFLQDTISSLNTLDQQIRKPQVQQTLGLLPYQSTPNAPVASDSTIRQALEGWPEEKMWAFADWMYRRLREEGLLNLILPSGLSLYVGTVDSSSLAPGG